MRRKQMMIAMGAVTLSLILGTAPLVQTGLAAQGERAYEQESEKRGKSVEASTVDLSKKGSITIRKYDITCGSEMWKRTWCIVMQRHWWN